MNSSIESFYDQLAEHYHLIFEDWDRSIERQAASLNRLLEIRMPHGPLKIPDCACGIGTQSIGFARAGHNVIGSDLSSGAVSRARREAELRGLRIDFRVADMTSLAAIPERDFDAVTALDNALPHLSQEQLAAALRAIYSRLRSGGIFLVSTRDYDELIQQRPKVQGPFFYGAEGSRRIVLQVWDWTEAAQYRLHQYISTERAGVWETQHFVADYRCLLREELVSALRSTGFQQIQWLTAAESGFYQPVVVATKPQSEYRAS